MTTRDRQKRRTGRGVKAGGGSLLLLALLVAVSLFGGTRGVAEASWIPSLFGQDKEVADAGSDAGGAIEITGLKTISMQDAQALLILPRRFIEENGVTTARADDAAFILQNGLREEGLMEATVEWAVEGDRVLLTVDEGPLMFVGKFTVEGHENLSTAAVRELATETTRERFGLRTDAAEIPFVRSDINRAANEIASLYEQLGYRDVEVDPLETTVRMEDRLVDISVTVREGNRYRIGKIELPKNIPEGVAKDRDGSVIASFEGKPYTVAVLRNLRLRAVEAGRKAGYFDADAEAEAGEPVARPAAVSGEGEDGGESGEGNPKDLFIDVILSADWGERYTLEGMTISGLEKVHEPILRRRYSRLFEKPFDPVAINKMTGEFLETGAFQAITVEPVADPDTATMTLDVKVEEGKRQRIGIFGGVDSYLGGVFGVEYRNANTFGRLHALDASVELSQRGLRGEIDYTDPWWRGTDWEATLGAFSLTRQNEGYRTLEAGLRFGFLREFGEEKQHKVSFGWRPSYTDLRDAEIEEIFLGEPTYISSPVTLGYQLSLVDNEQAPTKGVILGAGFGVAGSWSGSEIEFTRARFRAAAYQPIGPGTLRVGARTGIVWPGDDDVFPIDLRFFSGGATTVRSFRERDLGPRDRSGYPLGGEFVSTFNAEYHIPISGPFAVAPFVDAGNVIFNSDDAGLDEMHYAGGLSLLVNSPVGPIRIDYGHNLNRGDREPSGTWHFAFGFAF